MAVSVLQDPHIHRRSLRKHLSLFQPVSLSWPSLSLLPSADFLCVPSCLVVHVCPSVRPYVRPSAAVTLRIYFYFIFFFASLSYVTALRGRGHFNQYLKHNLLPPPQELLQMPRDDMTGWHLKTEGWDGPEVPCASSAAHVSGSGGCWERKTARTLMREIRKPLGSRGRGRGGGKGFFLFAFYLFVFLVVERRKNNGRMKTQSLGGQEPRVIHASRRDKSQTPKWKWNYSWRGVGGTKGKKGGKTLVPKRWRHTAAPPPTSWPGTHRLKEGDESEGA